MNRLYSARKEETVNKESRKLQSSMKAKSLAPKFYLVDSYSF